MTGGLQATGLATYSGDLIGLGDLLTVENLAPGLLPDKTLNSELE